VLLGIVNVPGALVDCLIAEAEYELDAGSGKDGAFVFARDRPGIVEADAGVEGVDFRVRRVGMWEVAPSVMVTAALTRC
jgi:hypothetical protein